MDFSENLTIPMKEQPQSVYWSLEQLSVHLGISKSKNGKAYHPYNSDCKKHDQSFSKLVMIEMLAEEDVSGADYIVVDSDNCSPQYKSGLHFYHLQEISNRYSTPIIHIYGIPGHGKGEVDHVGVTVHKMAASGHSFYNASDIVNALIDRYAESSVKYHIKEITVMELEKERQAVKSIKVATIEGSSSFRAMLFEPGKTTFKALSRICICAVCELDYGLCASFHEYSLVHMNYDRPCLRSDVGDNIVNDEAEFEPDEEHGERDSSDFLSVGWVVALANQESLRDSVWFIKIAEINCVADELASDSYGNKILLGIPFLKGHFLERSTTGKDNTIYKVSKLLTYFYRETILHPFVTLHESKKGLKLMDSDYIEIINYAQKNGFNSI